MSDVTGANKKARKPKTKRKKAAKKKEESKIDVEEWAKDQQRDSDEIRVLKRENQKLNDKIRNLNSGTSLIIEAVKEAYREPPGLVAPRAPRRNRSKKPEEIAVLHMSDTHVGKTTETYNSQIARDRVNLLATKIVEITETRRSSAKIEELRIYMGGDMIEGENIFPGQAHELDQPVFDQAVKTTPSIFSNMIHFLLEHFAKIKVVCVSGNHGRGGSKYSGIHHRTNWDLVCYEVTRLMVCGTEDRPTRIARDNRITFDISDTFYNLDRVFDWGSLIVHGHQIRGGFAGFPFYGVGKKAWGWIDSVPHPWDYLWFGHFHTYAGPITLNHRTYMSNGTTESSNAYAQENMASAGFPCQRLCFFNDKHGLINDHQVFLTDERQPQMTRFQLYSPQ